MFIVASVLVGNAGSGAAQTVTRRDPGARRRALGPRPLSRRLHSPCSSARLDEPQAHRLQLGSCCTERWWPPGTRDQPAPGRAQHARELARVLDRDLLVALGVEQQHRDLELAQRSSRSCRGEQPVERGRVGVEREPPVGEAPAAGPRRSPGRSRRPRAAPAAAAADDREVAAHARAPQRDRRRRVAADPRSQELRDRDDVVERAGRPSALRCRRGRAGRTRSPRSRRRSRPGRSRGGSPCTSRRRGGSRRRLRAERLGSHSE